MIEVSKSFYGANWANIRNEPFRIIENNISIRRHSCVLTDSETCANSVRKIVIVLISFRTWRERDCSLEIVLSMFE